MAYTEFPLPSVSVWQSGGIEVTNTAGVLKHKFYADSGDTTVASTNVTRISGASVTAASLPTVSSSVDFVSGLGVDSSGTHRLVLNVASQVVGSRMGGVNVEFDNTGSSFHKAAIQVRSLNINGVTRNWLLFALTDNSGNNVAVTTANIGSTKIVRIAFWVAIL